MEDYSNVQVRCLKSQPSFKNYEDVWEIPLEANAWISNGTHEVITPEGLGNWISSEAVIDIYLHLKETQKIKLFLKCKVPEGRSKIQVTLLDNSQTVDLQGDTYALHPCGSFIVSGQGYVRLTLQGIERTGDYFADVSHVVIPKLTGTDEAVVFCGGYDGTETYWFRRGPSTHWWYEVEEAGKEDWEYYYGEVMIPEGADVVGSYYMAVGFRDGYFGIQVNSKTERKVLFSVWSPQETDKAEELLPENKVILLDKSPDVTINTFDGEGSGGQSYLVYPWKVDTTYKFLVRGRPDPVRYTYTQYTAWFAPKDDPTFHLIASFARPQSGYYLQGYYSFLESFKGETAHIQRKGYYTNQWVCSKNGRWLELTRASLTGPDDKECRRDFEGGVEWYKGVQWFYLRNCGFFIGCARIGMVAARECSPEGVPRIDLGLLGGVNGGEEFCVTPGSFQSSY